MPFKTPRIDVPRNPNYGDGVLRRRIRLTGFADRVVAELEDNYHAFHFQLIHNAETITDIKVQTHRVPFNTCAGAVEPLRDLIGIKLNSSTKDITRQVSPKANCTHLFDLSMLAIAHCRRGEVVTTYDVTVTDENGKPGQTSVYRDGEQILQFITHNWQILQPAELAGKPLHKGFTRWANELYSGDLKEALMVLQKGYFISQARAYDLEKLAGLPASTNTPMLGACYSFSRPIVEQAIRTGNNIRDFSDSPEQLLKFI
ncbi:MAG: hypothetical protein ACJAYG_000713 [Oceanicoccus sp.]|jgi:hypothetical protein